MLFKDRKDRKEIESFLENKDSSTIPKIIWSFWEGEMPDLVKKCVDSWRKHNPTFTIIMLNKRNLYRYLPKIDFSSMKFAEHSPWSKKSYARLSDFVRLNLLATYGGIWMDATIICHKPLEWIYLHDQEELVGFYFEKFSASFPLIESWFLACKKGSIFMQNWCEEFMSVNTYESIDDYIENVKNMDIDISGIPKIIQNYLCVYISCQKVLQNNPSQYKIFLEKSEDGPSKFLYDNNFDPEKSVDALLTRRYNHIKLIKLRSQEKYHIMRNNINLAPLFDD